MAKLTSRPTLTRRLAGVPAQRPAVGSPAASQPLWTPRAAGHYYESFAGLKHRIVGVTRTAARRSAAGAPWHDGKKAVQGLPENVYELRATRAHRVLVQQVGAALVLVDVGDHDVVDRYVATKPAYRRSQLAAASETPPAFHPQTQTDLFLEIDDIVEPRFEEELDCGWLTFLSTEQAHVATELLTQISKHPVGASPFNAYLHGGAGTGKTAILLNLAMQLHDAGVPVRLECSPALTKHLTQYTRINLRALQQELTPGGVLLIDDPPSPSATESAVARAQLAAAAGVVVAYDPLQWRAKRLRQAMAEMSAPDYQHRLTTCYRQSSSLAVQAIEIMSAVHERSSWRVDPALVAEERQLLAELDTLYLSGLEFVKPGGRVRVIPKDDVAVQFAIEAARLRERWDRWRDMPALLVLEDREHGVQLTKATKLELQGIGRVTQGLADVPSYRGLDFQATWIFLSAEYFERIQQGKLGLSTKEWESLRDLHVAFTRGKDETLVFLI